MTMSHYMELVDAEICVFDLETENGKREQYGFVLIYGDDTESVELGTPSKVSIPEGSRPYFGGCEAVVFDAGAEQEIKQVGKTVCVDSYAFIGGSSIKVLSPRPTTRYGVIMAATLDECHEKIEVFLSWVDYENEERQDNYDHLSEIEWRHEIRNKPDCSVSVVQAQSDGRLLAILVCYNRAMLAKLDLKGHLIVRTLPQHKHINFNFMVIAKNKAVADQLSAVASYDGHAVFAMPERASRREVQSVTMWGRDEKVVLFEGDLAGFKNFARRHGVEI